MSKYVVDQGRYPHVMVPTSGDSGKLRQVLMRVVINTLLFLVDCNISFLLDATYRIKALSVERSRA